MIDKKASKGYYYTMSGHSKWSSIKHKKAITDTRRGKLFSKVAKMVSVAARVGGGSPDKNPKLRFAIDKARAVNMPKDNIERAIKRGTGEGVDKFEEMRYEAYGPAGIALIIEGITDNKNRTLSEIKHILSSYGGKLAEIGSVEWSFERKGVDWVPKYPVEVKDLKLRKRVEDLFEALDENDDVQEIYSNLKV